MEEVRRTGVAKTLLGRERPIPDMHSRNPNARSFAERTAVNTPLQGTAADLIKMAMIRIDRELAATRKRHGCCCRSTTNWCSKLLPRKFLKFKQSGERRDGARV